MNLWFTSISEEPVYNCMNRFYVVFNLIGNIAEKIKDNREGRFCKKNLKESQVELFKILDEDNFFENSRLLQAVKKKFVVENNL